MKLPFTRPYTSWTHRLARVAIRPLASGPVTPNHLTTLRLVTGLAACAGFAVGDADGNPWGGVLWLVSCFLDRADGELARLAKTTSRWGHLYDYYCDIGVNGLFFFTIGIGLRDGALGNGAIAPGTLASASVIAASILSEYLEERQESDDKAYAGILGFDFDDVLYLFAPPRDSAGFRICFTAPRSARRSSRSSPRGVCVALARIRDFPAISAKLARTQAGIQ